MKPSSEELCCTAIWTLCCTYNSAIWTLCCTDNSEIVSAMCTQDMGWVSLSNWLIPFLACVPCQLCLYRVSIYTMIQVQVKSTGDKRIWKGRVIQYGRVQWQSDKYWKGQHMEQYGDAVKQMNGAGGHNTHPLLDPYSLLPSYHLPFPSPHSSSVAFSLVLPSSPCNGGRDR